MKKHADKLIALLLIGILVISLTGCKKKYSVGEVDGNTYKNEWAELKVTLPDGYKMMDSSTTSAPEGFELGAAFAVDSSVPIPACYILTREGEADVDAIGEDFTKQFGGSSGLMNVSKDGTTYQVSVTKTYYTIADESFLCFHLSVSIADVYCAFREVDDTGVIALCVVTMSGYGSGSEEDVFKLFEKID